VGLAEIGLSLCFLYGGLTRVAGIGLGLVWLFGVLLVGAEAMMENLHYLASRASSSSRAAAPTRSIACCSLDSRHPLVCQGWPFPR
jgi:hypothetical protein